MTRCARNARRWAGASSWRGFERVMGIFNQDGKTMTTEPIEAPLIIASEEDAFRYLQIALDQALGDRPVNLEFKNWPLLSISMTGEGYDSTITPHMAQALVELQHAMNRTFARTVRGSSNPNVLTDAQKQSIEFKAKVEKGSSLVTVDLGEYASALAQGLVGKMDGAQLVMVALGSAVVAGSVVAYKALDFTAKLNTQTLTESHKEKLKAAEWGRQRLHLQVNATRLRREVTTAAIVGVEWPKD